jgi:hypothetical protein
LIGSNKTELSLFCALQDDWDSLALLSSLLFPIDINPRKNLFPKAKFVLGKNEWDLGGTIYNDYIKCCNGRIGLQTMTDEVRERYMEKIWMKALNKKIQKKALVQKRSAIYTVMQNKFAGKLYN